MSFDAADLLAGLFKAPPEAAPPEPARRPEPAPDRAPGPQAGRPAPRLPEALPAPEPAEWLAMWRRAPELTLPPQPCGWCGCRVFWHSTLGAYRCGRCHPPAYPALAAMWVQVVATEDGPQVVRLGGRPSKA
jgi:hypothetical protein